MKAVFPKLAPLEHRSAAPREPRREPWRAPRPCFAGASAWVLLTVLVMSGCNRPRWDKPDEAYRSFSSAVRRGEVKTAWNALSADTRKAAEARSKEMAQASGGSVKDEPMLMFFASGYKPLPQGDVKVAKEEGQTAVVEVAVGDGGVTQSQRMVKEGDRWAVDLTEAFK